MYGLYIIVLYQIVSFDNSTNKILKNGNAHALYYILGILKTLRIPSV